MSNEVKKFSDVVPSTTKLNRKELKEILDEEVTILDADWRQGHFGEYVVLTCHDDESDESFVVMTGASVLIKKLDKYLKLAELPVKATITKVNRYYDIS
jgi:hypothetical protein